MTWKADLDAALANAFSMAELQRLLVLRVGRPPAQFQGVGDFNQLRAAVIVAADSEGWLKQLVGEALWTNPENALLKRFRDTNRDVAPTSLKDTEIADLQEGLGNAFTTYERLGAMLLAKFGETIDSIVGRGVEAPPEDYVRRVIVWFDARAAVRRLIQVSLEWASHPALSVRAKAVTQAMDRREAQAGYQQAAPVDACLINERVFVSRDGLRAAVKELIPKPTKPIVAVNGPTQSGKTHSLELVRWVAVHEQGLEVATIDLKDEQHATFDPAALVRSIMNKMGRSAMLQYIPRVEDAGSAARWVRELCDWLEGDAKTSGKTWIIGLDGFCHPDLPKLTRDMVCELVKRAVPTGSRLRVVLVGYTDDLIPVDVGTRVGREDIKPPTDDQLKDYLGRLFVQEGISVEEGVVGAIVSDLAKEVPTRDIKPLADAIQVWLATLRERAAQP